MNTTNLLGPHAPETQKVLSAAWAEGASSLRIIDIARRNRGNDDTSSLSLGGRAGTPGFACVVGNLEHNAEIAPRTEAARLALIAWLESDECRAVAAKGTP